jgi:cytochrome c peroxidase
MKCNYILLIIAVIGLASCQKDQPASELDAKLENILSTKGGSGGIEFFKMPASSAYGQIPEDPRNPITESKVQLGKLLFHETGFAVNGEKEFAKNTFSCASCHFATAGFQAGRFQGIGEGGVGFGFNGEGRQPGPLFTEAELDVQPLRSPSAMNGAFQQVQLWNGQFGATGLNSGLEYAFTPGTPKETNELGYEGLETQAIAGMGVHRQDVNETLVTDLGYKQMFDNAFPDFEASKRYTKETAGLAIAAYERTLLSNRAPFQKWLNGDKEAMTEAQKRGAILFFDKAGCADCHTGPALNSMEFYALGMDDLFDCPEEVFKADMGLSDHKGRGGFTGNAEDDFKFKVPQLYNLKDSPFYGHGSSFRSIRSVIEYKNRAQKQNERVPNSQLASEFKPLGLSNAEIDDIVVFIKDGLYDPDLLRYQPASTNSGGCIPVNDPMAKADLGCN